MMHRMVSNSTKWLSLMTVYGFIYLPIAIVVVYSFNAGRYSLVWEGFSFHWYQKLFHDADILTVIQHSLVVGVLASSLATFLGSLAALCLYRFRFLGKRLLEGLIFTLIVVPDLVLGIALLLSMHVWPIPLGFWSLFIAHTTFCLPFAVVTLYNRVKLLDKYLFEAAKDLGASERVLFQRILLPLMLPAVLSAWLLCFTLSIDDVVISYFVSGPSYPILPLKIYSMVRLGVSPEINALSTLMLVVTLLAVFLAYSIRKRR